MPTIHHWVRRAMVGTLCFAHPTQRRSARTLPPLEIRDAALCRRLDAFLEVFRGAQLVLLDQFVIGRGEHAVGEAGAHGGAGRDQAERRAFGDFGGELHRFSPHLILRYAEVGETHAGGLLAGDAAAGVGNQFRIVLADQFGKRRGQAEAGMDAEFGEVGGEARLRAGDAEVS